MFLESPAFPACPNFGFQSQPMYSVTVVQTAPGKERRNRNWGRAAYQFDCTVGPRVEATIQDILEFWHSLGGVECGFRFRDYTDFKSCRVQNDPASSDQVVRQVTPHNFQMLKKYTAGAFSTLRPIEKPVEGTILVEYNGVLKTEGSDYTIDYTTGIISGAGFSSATLVKWGGEFDVPVRFNSEFPVQIVDKQIESVQFSLIQVRDISNELAPGSEGSGGSNIVSINGGNSSTGPWGGAPVDTGTPASPGSTGVGWWDGSNNNGGSTGSIDPSSGAEINGRACHAIAWSHNSTLGDYFIVALSGTLDLAHFNTIRLRGNIVVGSPPTSEPYDVTYHTNAVDGFDNSSQPGYTIWAWSTADLNNITGIYTIDVT